jgi:hypothetical protein
MDDLLVRSVERKEIFNGSHFVVRHCRLRGRSSVCRCL